MVDASATGGAVTCGATGLVLTVSPTEFSALAAGVTVTGKAGRTAAMNPGALAAATCSSAYGPATWGTAGGATTLAATATATTCSTGTDGSCQGSVTPLTPRGKLAVAPRHTCTIRASDGAVLCSGENQASWAWGAVAREARARGGGEGAASRLSALLKRPQSRAATHPPPHETVGAPRIGTGGVLNATGLYAAPDPKPTPQTPTPPTLKTPNPRKQWGQIGNGNTANTTALNVVLRPGSGSGPLTGATWVAAGGYFTSGALSGHTCACLNTGEAVCWGQNLGQVRGLKFFRTIDGKVPAHPPARRRRAPFQPRRAPPPKPQKSRLPPLHPRAPAARRRRAPHGPLRAPPPTRPLPLCMSFPPARSSAPPCR
jgi:hypothetical protein